METKFTKGEWVIYLKSVEYDGYANLWFCVLTNSEGVIIQKIYGRTKEEAEANAKLIAAAPKMYEELDSLVSSLERYFKNPYQEELPDINPAKRILKNATE